MADSICLDHFFINNVFDWRCCLRGVQQSLPCHQHQLRGCRCVSPWGLDHAQSETKKRPKIHALKKNLEEQTLPSQKRGRHSCLTGRVLVEALGGGVLVWRMCFLTDSQLFVLDAFFLWRVLSADSSSGLRNVHCPLTFSHPPKKSSTSIAHFCKIVESGEGSLNWNRVWLPMFLLFCIKGFPWSMATVIGKPQDKKQNSSLTI